MATKEPKKLSRDPAQRAHHIVALATAQIEQEPEQPDIRKIAAVALGALGAAKGGKARAKSPHEEEARCQRQESG